MPALFRPLLTVFCSHDILSALSRFPPLSIPFFNHQFQSILYLIIPFYTTLHSPFHFTVFHHLTNFIISFSSSYRQLIMDHPKIDLIWHFDIISLLLCCHVIGRYLWLSKNLTSTSKFHNASKIADELIAILTAHELPTKTQRSVINKIRKLTDMYDRLKNYANSTRPSIFKKRVEFDVKLNGLFNIAGIIPDDVSDRNFEFYCKSFRKSSTCSSLAERIPPKQIDPISFAPFFTSDDDDDVNDDLQPSLKVPESSPTVMSSRLSRRLDKEAAEKRKRISLTGVEERFKKSEEKRIFEQLAAKKCRAGTSRRRSRTSFFRAKH